MREFVLITCILLVVLGCSDTKNNKQTEEIEREAKDIVITQESQKVHEKDMVHEKELKGDKKDFYYALKDKNMSTDTTKQSFTRVDAQKNVKNKDSIDTIEERNTKKIDTPYNYIRIDLLKSALSKNFTVKCSSCHDDYANGIIGPSLLHKDGAFIFERLKAYKTKQKVNVFMQDLVKSMDNAELRQIANEIAEFNKEIRKMDTKQ